MKTNRGSILSTLLLIIGIVAVLAYLGIDLTDTKNIIINIWNFIKEPVLIMWEAFKSFILAPLQKLLQALAKPQ